MTQKPPANTTTPKQRSASKPAFAQTLLRRYFEAAVKHNASDLLVRGGQAPRLRLNGLLKPLDTSPPPTDQFEAAVESSLNDAQRKKFEEQGSLDLGIDLDLDDGLTHRFRVNIFRTRGRLAIAARRLNNTILDFASLRLPPVIERVVKAEQGLVLVAGSTGSGKSTTIASMLQHICDTRSCHIVTIEDPIEYLFTDAKAFVNQREIGIDVSSFSTGLRALVREDPDVVLIGEMRDKETFESALQAAETGHLVFGTIHAPSASQTFNRIYDLFSTDERHTIRNTLAHQLQALIFQKLLPTIRDDIPRIPAVEVLLQSPSTRKYILEEREHEIDQVVKHEREANMQTFNDSLIDLIDKQYIHPKIALAASHHPVDLKMRLKQIDNR